MIGWGLPVGGAGEERWRVAGEDRVRHARAVADLLSVAEHVAAVREVVDAGGDPAMLPDVGPLPVAVVVAALAVEREQISAL